MIHQNTNGADDSLSWSFWKLLSVIGALLSYWTAWTKNRNVPQCDTGAKMSRMKPLTVSQHDVILRNSERIHPD